MTTEVLRNMMYAGSTTLRGLGWVVMDEVHYLADRFRGAVWEEVIIHLPPDVSVVSLSATVCNAEEFGAWLGEVRGDTEVIVSEHRPVPLWQHMMVGQTIFDLFVEERDAREDDEHFVAAPGRYSVSVNPDLVHAIRGTEGRGAWDSHWVSSRGGRDKGRPRGKGARRVRGGRGAAAVTTGPGADARGNDAPAGRGPGGGDGGRGFARGGRPGGGATRAEVIERLEREGLLPAITFIFSRAGCDGAVGQLLSSGMRLIPESEGEANRRLVEERIQGLAEEDLSVLGYWDFVDGISRGFAAHHAGMLPTFREIVEELFTAGRVRAVFATETLALGINMPARTVVLEKLVKFNGENHVDISPAEYTQLTGRAGRRGIDIEGHAVVLWNRGLDPAGVAGLASTRTYPLRSSFRPTYNMAVNLVRQFGRESAREILETSFAQFQADRAVVGFVRTVRRNEEALAGYAEQMTCHLGDFTEYAAIRNEIRDVEKEGARARSASMRDSGGDLPGGAEDRRHRAHPGRTAQRSGRRRHAEPRRQGGVGVAGRRHRGPPAAPPDPARRARRRSSRSARCACPSSSTPATPRRAATSPRRCARRCRTTRRRVGATAERRPDGRPRRRAAPADEGAPVPPLSRPREPRPLGRALVAPAARDRRHPAQDRRPHELRRQDLRPHLRAARRDGLPRRRRPDGHR